MMEKRTMCLIGNQLCLAEQEKVNLIRCISDNSNKYGNKLIEFLEMYHIHGLRMATVEQLREYAINQGFLQHSKDRTL